MKSELLPGMYYWCKFSWSDVHAVFQYNGDGYFLGIGSDEYVSFLEFDDIYPVCGARHDTNLSLI